MAALGIIAGGGELPIAIAESARDRGQTVFVLALEGLADSPEIEAFSHAQASLGELGKAFRALKDSGCENVTLAGRVARPEWSALRLDTRGALALPKVVAAALKGDDAIMRTMIGFFEKDGFRVIGTAEAAPDLIAPKGVYGRHKPDAQALNDIALARQVVKTMGALDIGQAVAVCDGLVLAVEAAEGTDAMLERLVHLPKAVRGSEQKRRGVVVKAPKPRQDRRVDLPVIGTRTVELAAAGGLAGIAIEAGSALIMRKARMIEAADRLGVFVMGFEAETVSP
jgi:UDP-2,3-diacylglucosamine hydrolase